MNGFVADFLSDLVEDVIDVISQLSV